MKVEISILTRLFAAWRNQAQIRMLANVKAKMMGYHVDRLADSVWDPLLKVTGDAVQVQEQLREEV